MAITTWLLSLGSVGVGSIGTYLLGRAAERQRIAAEDERRWLKDRRALYSRYLALVDQLERDVHSVSCFLPHDEESPAISSEDEGLILEMSKEWIDRWESDLVPMLTEVELMATPPVADLADRTAHGLLFAVPQEVYGREDGNRITPPTASAHAECQAALTGLCRDMRNVMRTELGMQPLDRDAKLGPDWPWQPNT